MYRSVDFNKVIHFYIIFLPGFHLVKCIVQVIEIRQFFQLVLDGVLDCGEFQKESYLIQSIIKLCGMLEWLTHPSLQAPGPNVRLAFIKYLEDSVGARQNFLLHVLGEYLKGIDSWLIQAHKLLETELLQLKFLPISFILF